MLYKSLIQERLKEYSFKTIEEEELSLKEIIQEVILYSLAETNFFNEAAFHGGTALRILHKLPRFSEDLDFLLKKPNPSFKWAFYLDKILYCCQQFGLEPELKDKSELAHSNVPKIFLKQDSIGKLINLKFHHNPRKKLSIKLEIDVNPADGSAFEFKYLDFPTDFAVITQDLPSSFASKLHAVLCRSYVKGRDWYDFLWYLKKKIKPNLTHLRAALKQNGPWQSKNTSIDLEWLQEALKQKIISLDWVSVQNDVKPFLNELDRKALTLWSEQFFLTKLNLLN